MAEVCRVLSAASTNFYLKNSCLPEGYNGWIKITPYIESDVTGAYANTTVSNIKNGSDYEESNVQSFALTWAFSCKLKVDTYFSQALKIVDEIKKTMTVGIENNWQLKIEDPVTTEVYPLGSMPLNNPIFQNLASKEYVNDFTFQANGKPVVVPNPSYVPLTENPYDVDVNLTATPKTLDPTNLTIEWDTISTAINYNNMKLTIIDSTTGLTVETKLIEDGTTGTYDTTTGNYTSGDYEISLMAGESNFESNLIEVGYTTLNVTRKGTKGTPEETPKGTSKETK